MDPEEEGAPEAPRRSAHESQDAHREHAQRVLEQREAEWDRAKQELDRMQSHLNSALLEGKNVSTAERLLQDAKTRYDESKERYQELKEDAQRSTTAGESHAYHPPACVGLATPTSFCSDVSILVSLLGRRSPETRRHQALRFRLPLS